MTTKAEADAVLAEANEALQVASSFVIRSSSDRAKASRAIADLRKRIKEVDDKRKEATQPLDQAKRAIMSWVKPGIDAMKAAQDALTEALATYDRDQAEARTKALAAASATDDPAKARALVSAAVDDAEEDEHLIPVVTTDFEIVDPDAVPRHLCAPVASLIRAEVQAGREPPGVRVFEKTTYRRRK